MTAPVTKTLTLTNYGDADSILTLSGELKDSSGNPVDGVLTVDPATVTVPAHGSIDVQVTVDARDKAIGTYTGSLRALDASGAEALHLALAAVVKPPSHNLRLRPIPPDAWPSPGILEATFWFILRVDAPAEPIWVSRGPAFENTVGPVDVTVPDGVYMVTTEFTNYDWPSGGSGRETQTELVDPEVVVNGADTEVVVDGRTARPVTAITPRPSEVISTDVNFVRGTTFGGSWRFNWGGGQSGWGSELGPELEAVTPTKPVSVGSFRTATALELIEDPVSMYLDRPGRPEVRSADYASYIFQEPRLSFDGSVDLVDVGDGSAEAIDAAHVRARLALIGKDSLVGHGFVALNDAGPGTFAPALRRLQEAGALGAVAYVADASPRDASPAEPWWCGPTYFHDGGVGEACPATIPVPVITVGPSEGKALHEQLLSHGPIRVHLRSRAEDPSYTYRLRFDVPDVISGEPFRVSQDQLATVVNRYHGTEPTDIRRFDWANDAEWVGVSMPTWVGGTQEVTDYVGPVSPGLLWGTFVTPMQVSKRELHDAGNPGSPNFAWLGEAERMERFPTAQQRTTDWFAPHSIGAPTIAADILAGPLARVVPYTGWCFFCRSDSLLWTSYRQTWNDGTSDGWWGREPWQLDTHLYRDGQEILPPFPEFPFFWDLSGSPGAAHYRLTSHLVADPASPEQPKDVSTTWEFSSEEPTTKEGFLGFSCSEDPAELCRIERVWMIAHNYGRTLALDNTAPVPGEAKITLSVYQQAAAPATNLAGVREEVSFDDGANWQPAKVEPTSDKGRYNVKFKYPHEARTGDTVSLRTSVWDDAGNRTEQTMLGVYSLVRKHGKS